MSSRNSRLTKAHLKAAPFIFKTLQKVKMKFETEAPNTIIEWVEKEFEKQSLLTLEYFTIADEKNTKKTSKIKMKKHSTEHLLLFLQAKFD